MREERAGSSTSRFTRFCALCGREFDTMEGRVDDGENVYDLCHPADADGPMTCYHRWTVYGDRP
jgi:hypothetical protein